jgi:hypothetical protein
VYCFNASCSSLLHFVSPLILFAVVIAASGVHARLCLCLGQHDRTLNATTWQEVYKKCFALQMTATIQGWPVTSPYPCFLQSAEALRVELNSKGLGTNPYGSTFDVANSPSYDYFLQRLLHELQVGILRCAHDYRLLQLRMFIRLTRRLRACVCGASRSVLMAFVGIIKRPCKLQRRLSRPNLCFLLACFPRRIWRNFMQMKLWYMLRFLSRACPSASSPCHLRESSFLRRLFLDRCLMNTFVCCFVA